MTTAILFAGPSGAGKTSIIENIIKINLDFEHIFIYMTRPLRKGEKDRATKTKTELEQMYEKGEILYLLQKHNVFFGPSTISFQGILNRNKIPMIEMSIYDIDTFRNVHKDILVVYVVPPSKEILGKRLLRDSRDNRYYSSLVEMDDYLSGKFDKIIDFRLVCDDGKIEESARKVINHFNKLKQNPIPIQIKRCN